MLAALVTGSENLRRHLGIVREFGLPCVVAVNRRPGDTDEEVRAASAALALGARRVRGRGQRRLQRRAARARPTSPQAVADACEQPPSASASSTRTANTITEKITAVATRVYGASDIFLYPDAEQKIAQYTEDGLDKLPICMAKTHLSLSADPELLNAPEGFTLPVRDMRAYTGAGWLVPLCGDIQQMPGLGKTPAALNVDIDADGRTVGLF